MIVLYLLMISGGFFLNHLMMRGVSGRNLTRFDVMLLVWCFGYIAYLFLLFIIGNQRNTPNLPDGWIGRAIGMLLSLGLPAMVSAWLSYLVWHRIPPSAALLVAATIIAVLPLAVSFEVYLIGSVIIWNAAYAGACLPIALELRRTDERAQTSQCLACGYPIDGGPADSPCPECGTFPDTDSGPVDTSLGFQRRT